MESAALPEAASTQNRLKLILASASPRRKQLLEDAGYDVTCVVSGAEEVEDSPLPPAALALENAARKADRVIKAHADQILIAADTVVWKAGRFFGKPADFDAAFRMLRELAGDTHEVVTGVVIHIPRKEDISFAESSLVTFHPLDDEQIRQYLMSIHPLDKAGAYAAQNDEGRIIKKIQGSVSNVVGLPMERIGEMIPHDMRKSPI